jgi:2-(1,2-epoxy-1,2-dihydrophenyl)acetyl-CoA isomerase
MSHTITLSIENNIAFITLNRPDKYNSVNKELAMEFHKFLDQCKADDNIRCVYLTGTGKAFCAGQDLAEVVDPDGPALESIVNQHYNPIIQKIYSLNKPVVCAVNGVAAGAGANIALACDIVVAAESASFIQAFSKIGLIPDSGGTFTLPRLIGYQRASALMMLGDKVSATEAENMGMIYKCFSDDVFEESSLALAAKLANMPTYGLALTKEALQKSASNNMDEQLSLEHQLQTKAGKSADYHEGVASFLEKRKPNFIGK